MMATHRPGESREKRRTVPSVDKAEPAAKKAARKKSSSTEKETVQPAAVRPDAGRSRKSRDAVSSGEGSASSARKSKPGTGEVRPLDAREIKRIFSRSPDGGARKQGPDGQGAVAEPEDGHRPSLPARKVWTKIAMILGPSLCCVLVLFLVPGMREAVFGVQAGIPARPLPTNLLPSRHDPLFLSPTLMVSNQIVAYYGHPQARWMGIVGRHPKEILGPMLSRTAAAYDRINGPKKTVPAFYLIWGSAQPRGEIQFMDKRILDSYIRYTATNGYLLILDHQIGKYGPIKAVEQLLPFLRYPHVHLAIDPEWRTLRPMKEIGYVTGEEINQAQALMRTYILTNRIPGKRMLIVHQFEDKMFVRRHQIRTVYDPVVFVHSVSGWGSPSMKLGTWNRHTQATNLPHKGFKLWYYPGIQRPGLHYDYPLMSHQAVVALQPSPVLIMYQ
mgnify:CR=1 FL=1